jgi:hypothetical protein
MEPKRMRRAEYVPFMKEIIRTYTNMARNPEGRSLRKRRCEWEDNIKVDVERSKV